MATDSRANAVDIGWAAGVLFDMDGVVADTTNAHRLAWSTTLSELTGSGELSWDQYRGLVDGRPRLEGVTAMLRAHGIARPIGSEMDAPGTSTLWSIANLKNQHFLRAIHHDPALLHACAVRLIRRLQAVGTPMALVTSSRNRAAILGPSGIGEAFAVIVDGTVMADRELPGKPDPAPFVEAAAAMGVAPQKSVVLEDSSVGVRAAKAGGFGMTIGVDRVGRAGELVAAGADRVVSDLDAVVVRAAEASADDEHGGGEA